MKRKILIIIALAILGSALNASPIAFNIDSSYEIEDLLSSGFTMRYDDEDSIIVTPPKSKIGLNDKDIAELILICPDGADKWIAAGLKYRRNTGYDTAYKFISRNYGEGLSKESTKFFAEHYSKELSDEVILTKLLSGDLGQYLLNTLIAELLNEIIDDENIKDMNMWITDDLYIFTADSSNSTEGPVAVFFRTETITSYVNSILDTAFLSML